MAIIRYNHKLNALAGNLRRESTQSEVRLWQELKGKKVGGYCFTRQKPIGNYIADFYCAKLGLVIELDGITHLSEETMNKDEEKELYLKSVGIQVLRFIDSDIITDMPNVLREIEYYMENFEKR